jgi:hypothetical protein
VAGFPIAIGFYLDDEVLFLRMFVELSWSHASNIMGQGYTILYYYNII